MTAPTAFLVDLNQQLQPRVSVSVDPTSGAPTMNTIDGNGNPVATGVGSGIAAFASLTGQPTDNANLAASLNAKAPGATNTVAGNRALTNADNGAIIPTPSAQTFTVPTGLGSATNRFGCSFFGAGAVTVSGSGTGGQATVTDHRTVVGAVGYFQAGLIPTGLDTYDLVGTKAS